jgi:hypothetical protein
LLLLLAAGPAPAADQPASIEEYVRVRQRLGRAAAAGDARTIEVEARRAREAVLDAAARGSRLLVALDRQRAWDVPGLHEVVRLVARGGRVRLEAFSGPRASSPIWARAGELDPAAYRALLERLLEAPAFLADVPAQRFDPNAPGPRRAVTLRLAVGGEERWLEALYGAPYERLAGLAAAVVEFCRTMPLTPAEGARP